MKKASRRFPERHWQCIGDHFDGTCRCDSLRRIANSHCFLAQNQLLRCSAKGCPVSWRWWRSYFVGWYTWKAQSFFVLWSLRMMCCFLSLLLDSLWPWLSTQKACSRCNRTWKPVLPVSLSCTVNTLNRAGTKAQSHLSSSLTEEQPKHGICMFRLQLLLSTWTNGFSWIEAMEQQVVDGLWNSLNESCKHATVVIFYGFYWDSTLDTQESL